MKRIVVFIFFVIMHTLYGMKDQKGTESVKQLLDEPIKQETLRGFLRKIAPIPSEVFKKQQCSYVCISPDKSYIGGIAEKEIFVWSREGDSTLKCDNDAVQVIMCFSANNKYFAHAADDVIQVRNIQDGKCIKKLHTNAISGLRFSPDSTLLVGYGYNKQGYLWNKDNDQSYVLQHNIINHYPFRFSSDSKYIIFNDDFWSSIWDREGKGVSPVMSKEEYNSLTNGEIKRHDYRVYYKEQLELADYYGTVRTITDQIGAINHARISDDGDIIVSASRSGIIHLWYLAYFNKIYNETISSTALGAIKKMIDNGSEQLVSEKINTIIINDKLRLR